jgi:hypothetical protein
MSAGARSRTSFDRAANLGGEWMAGAAEIGEGEHGYARLLIEVARLLSGFDGDLGQFFGAGLDIEGGIGKEIQVSLGRDQDVDASDSVQAVAGFDDLEGGPYGIRVVRLRCIRMAKAQHQAAEGNRSPHQVRGFGAGQALRLAETIKFFGVFFEARELGWIDDLRSGDMQMQVSRAGSDDFFVSQKDRRGDLFVEQDLAGAGPCFPRLR